MRRYRKLVREQQERDRQYVQILADKMELQYKLNEQTETADALQKRDTEIRSLHQSVRQLKHDMKNHLMVVASYLSAEDYDSVRTYISEILDKLNTVHSYIDTGNALMNHILNEKLELAREQGVSVKAEIENLAFAGMKSMDFSELLSNMLDNAIEACDKEPETAKELQVMVSRQRGYEVICVKNKIRDSVLEHNPQLRSSKQDASVHGLGIPRIREIIDTYQGICEIYEQEGFFCVCAFIPQ